MLFHRRGALSHSFFDETVPDSPIKSQGPNAYNSHRYLTCCIRLGLAVLCSGIFVFYLFCAFEFVDEVLLKDHQFGVDHSQRPPLSIPYSEYHERERSLPQHNLSAPFPDGKHAKYFWARNHVENSGWGNTLQELIMNAHLAYVSRRAFVFDNFTWDKENPGYYSQYNGNFMPSRIPLSAMIGGPIVGDPFPPGNYVPRAVHKDYFYEVCPQPTVIDSWEVNEKLRVNASVPASTILNKWVEKLNSIEDPCVEVAVGSFQIFEIWIFGTNRILDIWPSLSQSPILQQFTWSPLVRAAFDTNKHLYEPSLPWYSRIPLSLSEPSPSPIALEEPLPGLLVLHIRRGDFHKHCAHLAKWSADWNGFNAFPSLPDKFVVPPGPGEGFSTPENTQHYMNHCYPNISQIVDKVTDISQENAGLKNIYIMTNAKTLWIRDLKQALMSVRHWDKIASSKELVLNWEQKHVAQTVDLMIAQKAQVFIGNGFSSMTSHTVMLRMAKGSQPETNRMW